MLEDGPLLAPCCYHLPPSLDPAKVFQWFHRLEVHLLTEIFTLSGKSVLYEMALHSLQRPRPRHVVFADSTGPAPLMRYFSDTLKPFKESCLLMQCRQLFMNHLEAGLSCVRFLSALERLLPVDSAPQPTPSATNGVGVAGLGSEDPGERCTVEEVDRDRWLFLEGDGEGPQDLFRQGSSMTSTSVSSQGPGRRLAVRADAKLAYSVMLFVWSAVRLLSRRIELLQEFPPDHPLFSPARAPETPKVDTGRDSFEARLTVRRQASHAARLLLQQEEWQAAADAFSEAIDLAPGGDEGAYFLYQHRGLCHLRLEHHPPAVADFTAALAQNPHAPMALAWRAKAYEALGQVEAALSDITLLLRLYPDSPEGQAFFAQLQEALPPSAQLKPPPWLNGTGTPFVPPKGPATPPGVEHAETPNACLDAMKSPMTASVASGASLCTTMSFGSAQLDVNLAALPPVPEPLSVDDPPYLSAFMESDAELEYTICCGKELGRGAFGRVYKAVHASGGWFMAVKEVEAKYLEGSEDLLSALELMGTMHNNIVRCLGLRRMGEYYHIALEYCSGGSLRSLADELRGLSLTLMRKYAMEVLFGLRYIHSHGLIHRDIKGGNILLRDDGTAKIADFGTCLRIRDAEPPPRDVSLKGTVLWMAPETFRGRYCPGSDIWSFGCVLIEMATARDPWHEQQFQEQLTAMVFIATRPDAMPVIPPLLNDDLGRHFFHCCIARDPSERVSADLLLRHPWLSSTDPVLPGSPCSTIPDSYRPTDNNSCKPGFQWTATSTWTDSSFMDTTASTSILDDSVSRS
eukprot:EG_transcript_1949